MSRMTILSIGQEPEVMMSDEEFQELYLGNIPAHKRGKSLFLPSAANNRGPSSDSDSCYGSFLSPTSSPRKPRRDSEGGKRISFEFANPGFVPDESGDLQKANGFGTHLDPAQLERKPSRDSTDTLDSHRGSTGSDVSYSRTVAAHVRRDSIALFSDKLHSSPLRRLSLYKLAADLEQLRQEHNQMSKKEILAKYRVHIFVVAIFIISVLFISLGWFYRDKTEQEDSARQKIFLDPRKRILTLSDGHDEVSVLLGQDIPQWQLPMHCQLVEEDNPNSKECLWKNNAVVRVNFFQERVDGGTDTVGCYNVSWETLRSSVVPYDCFNLGTAEWYGPSNQSDGTWPVQGNFSYVPTPYRMGNNGVFSNVFQPYWLSSTGVGLLLNADEPITLQWNTSRPGYLCVVSNYTGPLYGQTYQSRLPFLNYTICNGQDINQTHRVMKTLVRGATPVDLIPREVILNPIWSAKELAGTERYNETHIQDFVTKLKTNGMNCSLLVMDGDWQDKHGDLTFDPARFANLANLTELLQTACSLSLEVTPYFDYRSVENFHTVVENFFVRDDGGRVPGLTRYRQTRPAPWWTSRDRKHARGSATP
ncbi:uncharacterized protein LOC112572749 isoform X2 [Pomacea canaliculata]|uniref:uncharacterized protein LOC112572749 isoform X2 n=1 Tax=Pomacea canaliculata TaxID=400727 RepID=UPI000D72E103|nr:uncharacterized protein LOC112572749 isoform X2 [Pomacea canaliculata]